MVVYNFPFVGLTLHIRSFRLTEIIIQTPRIKLFLFLGLSSFAMTISQLRVVEVLVDFSNFDVFSINFVTHYYVFELHSIAS